MKIYLVGGAVRDRLLELPERERDWLVTDTTPHQMQTLGYRQVGREFPVFLHPETGEEYALPRHGPQDTELGTIEEDLIRRDLTINAIALGPDGECIDPCGGRADLERRILRHTPFFVEDPLRILRLARFAARYQRLGFRVADETRELAQCMVSEGRLDQLVPERAWGELSRALEETNPLPFFEVLRQCDALAPLLPELERLFGIPQSARYHPEIDSGRHTLLALEQACRLSDDPKVRFTILLHDLGKGVTPQAEWPHHRGHEQRGADLIERICQRLRIPNAWRDLAVLVARYHSHCHRAFELRPGTLLKTLKRLDALRRPERFEQFLLACTADRRGREGSEQHPYPQAGLFRAAREAAAGVDTSPLIRTGDDNAGIARRLERAQLAAITQQLKSQVLRRKFSD